MSFLRSLWRLVVTVIGAAIFMPLFFLIVGLVMVLTIVFLPIFVLWTAISEA